MEVGRGGGGGIHDTSLYLKTDLVIGNFKMKVVINIVNWQHYYS